MVKYYFVCSRNKICYWHLLETVFCQRSWEISWIVSVCCFVLLSVLGHSLPRIHGGGVGVCVCVRKTMPLPKCPWESDFEFRVSVKFSTISENKKVSFQIFLLRCIHYFVLESENIYWEPTMCHIPYALLYSNLIISICKYLKKY